MLTPIVRSLLSSFAFAYDQFIRSTLDNGHSLQPDRRRAYLDAQRDLYHHLRAFAPSNRVVVGSLVIIADSEGAIHILTNGQLRPAWKAPQFPN